MEALTLRAFSVFVEPAKTSAPSCRCGQQHTIQTVPDGCGSLQVDAFFTYWTTKLLILSTPHPSFFLPSFPAATNGCAGEPSPSFGSSGTMARAERTRFPARGRRGAADRGDVRPRLLAMLRE